MRAPEIPSWWEGLIKGYLKRTFYPGTRRADFSGREEFTDGDYQFFIKGVARLNAYFTRERGSLPKDYFNQKDLRSGYLLYFLPVNALKVAALLGQSGVLSRSYPPAVLAPLRSGGGPPPTVPPQTGKPHAGAGGEGRAPGRAHVLEHGWAEPEPGPAPFTVLDIGSGPGTGMLGVMAWLKGGGRMGLPLRLKWILVDQNRKALEDAVRIHDEAIEHLQIQSEIETHVADISSGRIPRLDSADLILCLNFLSELPRERRRPLVETLLERCRGTLLIMEPALQRTTRELMELHDEIVQRGSGVVLAPCLHQAACPMLRANKRDWCHTYVEWGRPGWIERIDRLVGIRKEHLKCSYILLGGTGRGGSRTAPTFRDDTWRVVSGHLNSKGKSELLFCGPSGLPNLLRVSRLDRDRSETNRVFDKVQRGEVVEMEKCSRVGRDTTIRPYTPIRN